jgi:putative addiction module killer protein
MLAIQTTELFDDWFNDSQDRAAKARIQTRIDRAEAGNFGDCRPFG